jgi:hypothetical protein
MDTTALGVATAALTLYVVLLEQLVRCGSLTPAQAMAIADKSLDVVTGGFGEESMAEVSEAALACLMSLRKDMEQRLAAAESGAVN